MNWQLACRFASGEMLLELLNAGADVNVVTGAGKSLLAIAVSSANIEACKVLLERGADPNFADRGGSTPLMWAIQNAALAQGHEIIDMLLKAGANVNLEDQHAMTAFDRLCRSRADVSFAKLLIQHGAKHIKIPSKNTPLTSLMMAAQHGNTDLCMYLVEELAYDPFLQNMHNHSAIDFAKTKGFTVLADALGHTKKKK